VYAVFCYVRSMRGPVAFSGSILTFLLFACEGTIGHSGFTPRDGGVMSVANDGGSLDAGFIDAGRIDSMDGGLVPNDAGAPDAESMANPADAYVKDDAGVEHDAHVEHDAGVEHDAHVEHDANVQDDAGTPTAIGPFVYVGQTNGDLVTYEIEPMNGDLTRRSSLRAGDFPGFAAVAPDGHRMVVVNTNAGQVAALTIASQTGATELVNTRSSRGNRPTHVTVEQEGRYAFVANYGDGTVAMLPIGDNGSLMPASDSEFAGINAHCVVVDRSGQWLLVAAKGADVVVIFAIDFAAGTITQHDRYPTANGAGPRHLEFDTAGTHAYLINEQDSTVDVLLFDPTAGALSHLQTLSTLPTTFAGMNTAAEILISPDGRFVYASNRGHDSIAVFGVQSDGRLAPRGRAMLGARGPRSMAIDPSGTFLIAGALESSVLVRFRIGMNGALTRLGNTPTDGRPHYVGIFAAPD
jgi:6-phosphogluconolactonase